MSGSWTLLSSIEDEPPEVLAEFKAVAERLMTMAARGVGNLHVGLTFKGVNPAEFEIPETGENQALQAQVVALTAERDELKRRLDGQLPLPPQPLYRARLTGAAKVRDATGQYLGETLTAGTEIEVWREANAGIWPDRAFLDLTSGRNVWRNVLERLTTGGGGEGRLAWPTDFPVVTQRFGANPAMYAPFGFPGHEGIDIRAPAGSPVYACADGVVYRIQDSDVGAYGIHIRIRHVIGGKEVKTISAHLQQVLVSVGDIVVRGQKIGMADDTGNSFGDHLHLTLKVVGEQLPGWPAEIVDPLPWLME